MEELRGQKRQRIVTTEDECQKMGVDHTRRGNQVLHSCTGWVGLRAPPSSELIISDVNMLSTPTSSNICNCGDWKDSSSDSNNFSAVRLANWGLMFMCRSPH